MLLSLLLKRRESSSISASIHSGLQLINTAVEQTCFSISAAQDRIIKIKFAGSKRGRVEIGQKVSVVFSVGEFEALESAEWM